MPCKSLLLNNNTFKGMVVVKQLQRQLKVEKGSFWLDLWMWFSSDRVDHKMFLR